MFRIRTLTMMMATVALACGGRGAKSASVPSACPATAPEMPAGQLMATSRKVADRDAYDCVSISVRFVSVSGSAQNAGLDSGMLVMVQDLNTSDGFAVVVPDSAVQPLYSVKQDRTLRMHGQLRKVSDGQFPMFFVSTFEVSSAEPATAPTGGQP